MGHIVEQLFENGCCLSYYPRPNWYVHNNRTEFIDHKLRKLLTKYRTYDIPTTVKHWQFNAIVCDEWCFSKYEQGYSNSLQYQANQYLYKK